MKLTKRRLLPDNALSPAERESLVLSCRDLCYSLANRAAGKLPRAADRDDLAGEALLACYEAARKFDPDAANGQQAKFSTYATKYIVKRLKAKVAAQCRHAVPAAVGDWGPIPDRDAHEPGTAVGLSDDDRELLVKIQEPARSVVRLLVFERLTAEQVAIQLDLQTKDVKLMARNSAPVLAKAKLRLCEPGLFDSIFGADAEGCES